MLVRSRGSSAPSTVRLDTLHEWMRRQDRQIEDLADRAS